jgi:hypothetical protein
MLTSLDRNTIAGVLIQILGHDLSISGTDVGDVGGLTGLLQLSGEHGNGDSDQNGHLSLSVFFFVELMFYPIKLKLPPRS